MSKLYLVNNGIYHKCAHKGSSNLFAEYYIDGDVMKCFRAISFKHSCKFQFPIYLSIGCTTHNTYYIDNGTKLTFYIIGERSGIHYKAEYEKFVIDV